MSFLGYDYSGLFKEPENKKFKPCVTVFDDMFYVYFYDKSYTEISPPELMNTFVKIEDSHNRKRICGYGFHLPSCDMDGRKRFSKKDTEKMIDTLLSKVKEKSSKKVLGDAKKDLKKRGFI